MEAMRKNNAMRCFLPLTVPDLACEQPAAFRAGAPAFADTPALRAALADCDDEQRSYSALLSAGDYSALACHQRYPRRVVVAADAKTTGSADAELAAQVELAETITWQQVVALFVDEQAAEAAVAAAASSAADLESLEQFDLLWYHPSERQAVFESLTGGVAPTSAPEQ